ncbi:hypothetical protein J1N39_23155 [Pseudomonas aeruginosa]|uniref:hypothetical protein n=1 Tax=Pseudomonas aeruginosa TaxID=287 RepID=UPI001CBB558B|nr:hypothetical protein [Pseudomonas aeruginosa]MBZ3677377.1 hypothetical protein [Pseudomonas aeruginosa]MBZ3688372.1 hypothetical protein [Pseudomonas aeruginosa]
MPLPLIPLLAGQAIRVLGPQAIRHIAAKEAFGLAESALAKRAMPLLGEALTKGENFIPGTGAIGKMVLGSTPGGLGQLLGKADIISDVAGKALTEIGPKVAGMAIPGLGVALQAVDMAKKAADAFGSNQNAGQFLSTMSKLDLPSMLSAGEALGSKLLPQLVQAISELLKSAATYLDRAQESLAPNDMAPR